MSGVFYLSSLGIVSLSVIVSLLSNNILVFWLLVEISAFYLIYIFLSSNDSSNVNFSSFVFYLSNGISSIILVSGVYFNSSWLVYSALSCKFFMFPFSVLLLYVFENVNWGLIFIIGSLFKGLVLCLSYLSVGVLPYNTLIMGVLSCVFLFFSIL